MFEWLFGKRMSPKEFETSVDAMQLEVDACFYIMADDGKDKVVNRHLQKRADHLEKHAAKMRARSNKASTRQGRA